MLCCVFEGRSDGALQATGGHYFSCEVDWNPEITLTQQEHKGLSFSLCPCENQAEAGEIHVEAGGGILGECRFGVFFNFG